MFLYELMEIWVIFTFWILGIILLFMCKFSCAHMFSFLLAVYLWLELLACIVTLCLTFGWIARLFSRVAVPFYIPACSVWGFQFVHILANTCYWIFILAILMGIKPYLIVNLVCISLMTNDIERLCVCLLVICISSLERCLFRSSAHFKFFCLIFEL